MNKTTTLLTALSLVISTAAMAQKNLADNGTIAPHGNGQLQPRIEPAKPVVPQPVHPPVVKKEAAASSYSTEMAEYNLRRAKEANRVVDQKVGPQLKNTDGVIRIDFGIARQGESFSTFFPFNIATLENKETPNTPTLALGEYESYSRLTSESGITNVKLASGKLMGRATQKTTSANGFDLVYAAGKIGPVDEMVEVFTKKGNLIFHLTGYVVASDTKVSMQ